MSSTGLLLAKPRPGEMPITKLASHFGAAINVPHVLVGHCEQAPDTPSEAENVAEYDSHGSTLYAAHYAVDSDSDQHMVPEGNIAFHAPPNLNTVGIEQSGYAEWSAAQWKTPTARAGQKRFANLARNILQYWHIPIVFLTSADQVAGKWGITSHWNRSLAYHQSTHTDPGSNYPWDDVMQMVEDAAPGSGPTPPKSGDLDMPDVGALVAREDKPTEVWHSQSLFRVFVPNGFNGPEAQLAKFFGVEFDHKNNGPIILPGYWFDNLVPIDRTAAGVEIIGEKVGAVFPWDA